MADRRELGNPLKGADTNQSSRAFSMEGDTPWLAVKDPALRDGMAEWLEKHYDTINMAFVFLRGKRDRDGIADLINQFELMLAGCDKVQCANLDAEPPYHARIFAPHAEALNKAAGTLNMLQEFIGKALRKESPYHARVAVMREEYDKLHPSWEKIYADRDEVDEVNWKAKMGKREQHMKGPQEDESPIGTVQEQRVAKPSTRNKTLEKPDWLTKHGRDDKAQRSENRLRRKQLAETEAARDWP